MQGKEWALKRASLVERGIEVGFRVGLARFDSEVKTAKALLDYGEDTVDYVAYKNTLDARAIVTGIDLTKQMMDLMDEAYRMGRESVNSSEGSST